MTVAKQHLPQPPAGNLPARGLSLRGENWFKRTANRVLGVPAYEVVSRGAIKTIQVSPKSYPSLAPEDFDRLVAYGHILDRLAWKEGALAEFNEATEEAIDEGLEPPSKGALKLAERLIHKLSRLALPRAAVFPDDNRSISIQMGSRQHRGSILLSSYGDGTIECFAVADNLKLQCKYSDSEQFPDSVFMGILRQFFYQID